MKPNMKLQQLLDECLVDLTAIQPSAGWVKATRLAIGMSLMQLAKRLDITHPALLKLENAELDGKITVEKLDQVARQMNCRVVYGFVPETTFAELVTQRAQETASESPLHKKSAKERRDLWNIYSMDEPTPTRGGRRNRLPRSKL